MSNLPYNGSFPIFSSLTSGLGSLTAYLRPRKCEFDEEWAIETACRQANIRYERDPDDRERILAEVMGSDPKKYGIFAKTYESIRPIQASGETKGYGENKPKSSKGMIALLVGGGVAIAALGGTVLANNLSDEPEPTPYIIIDKDKDGLPDDLEIQWGYSTDEKDVRLKYWVQNPEENKGLVDAALDKVVKDYKEKNPLHIKIHTYYAGEIPENVKLDTREYADFVNHTKEEYFRFASYLIERYNNPTIVYQGNLEDVFFDRGYFLEDEHEHLGTGGASGVKSVDFFATTQLDGGPRPIEYLAKEVMHEMGHNMGLDHSSNPESVMWSGNEFIEEEWALLKNEPLLDFRPNEIVAKYVPE